ncbi:MAG: hypothetical protein ACRELE_05995 [Gemmatimonadales bacterium]
MVSSIDLQVYSESLEGFELGDIRAVVEKFGMEPRRDGETAFPSLGDLAKLCREVRYTRKAAEATAKVQADAQHRIDHPEEYVSIAEDVVRLLKAKGMDMPTREEALASCPHCNEILPMPRTIQFWTADEIEAYLPLKRELEATAKANRERVMKPVGAA